MDDLDTSQTSNKIGMFVLQFYIKSIIRDIYICRTAIANLSDRIGYLLDFTNPYYTALAGNMKARAKKDNSFWNHT